MSETILPLRASKLALAQPRTVNPLMPGAKLQALSPKPCHACRLNIRFTMDLHHLLWLRPALECIDTYDNAGHTSRHSFSRVSQAKPYNPKMSMGYPTCNAPTPSREAKKYKRARAEAKRDPMATGRNTQIQTLPDISIKDMHGVATCNIHKLPKTIHTDVTGAQRCTLCFPHERTACSQTRSHKLARRCAKS